MNETTGNQTGRCAMLTLALGFLLLLSPSARAFSNEVQILADELAREVAASGATSIAVVDFTDLGGDVTRAGRLMADEFTVALVTSNSTLQVVDRNKVERLVEEIGFGRKGLVSQDQLQHLGRMLSAKAIVFGNVMSLGDSARLSVRVLEVESARSLAAGSRLLPMSAELQALFYGRTGGSPKLGTPLYTETYGQLEYSIFPCRRDRRRVTCELRVTARRRGLSFALDGKVRAVDELGTEHAVWYMEASQGRQRGTSVEADLIENVPLRITLIFEGVSTEADKIALDLASRPMPIQASAVPILQ